MNTWLLEVVDQKEQFTELDTTADDNGIVFTLKEENSAAKKKNVKDG